MASSQVGIPSNSDVVLVLSGRGRRFVLGAGSGDSSTLARSWRLVSRFPRSATAVSSSRSAGRRRRARL